MTEMKNFRIYKTYVLMIFSFLLGCMITNNLTPINKTCRIEDTDREYNIMRNSKLKNPDLIIIILSSPLNLNKRNTVRQTWLKLTTFNNNVKFKMKHYFVIGSLGLSVDEVLHLSAEQSEFDDILLLPMYDSYQNLTQKVLNSFEWLDEQFNYGLGFKYVLKCDDDSFVRLDKLAGEIMSINVSSKSDYISTNLQSDRNDTVPDLYWGYFSGKARIQNSGKWRENNWITCDKYVPYALGGGYVLSKNLVSYLAKNAATFRKFNSEDTSVGLWLAPANNILRVHDVRFDTEWRTRGCQNRHLITHSVSMGHMGDLYDNIVKTGNLCVKEEMVRGTYLYDWGVSPSQCCTIKG